LATKIVIELTIPKAQDCKTFVPSTDDVQKRPAVTTVETTVSAPKPQEATTTTTSKPQTSSKSTNDETVQLPSRNETSISARGDVSSPGSQAVQNGTNTTTTKSGSSIGVCAAVLGAVALLIL
jgi:hypothetical protein